MKKIQYQLAPPLLEATCRRKLGQALLLHAASFSALSSVPETQAQIKVGEQGLEVLGHSGTWPRSECIGLRSTFTTTN